MIFMDIHVGGKIPDGLGSQYIYIFTQPTSLEGAKQIQPTP